MIVMITVFLICWSPYAILSTIGLMGFSKVILYFITGNVLTVSFNGNVQTVPLYMTVFPLMFAKSATVWNPVIFFGINPMVRYSFSTFNFGPVLHFYPVGKRP